MRIRVLHDTVFRYERPVKALIQLLRLTPQDHEGQHVRHWRIEPSADGALRAQRDAFGNVVHVFSASAPLEELTIRVAGEVVTQETRGSVLGAEERLPDLFYLRDSEAALADGAIRGFAADHAGDVVGDPLGAMHRLLAALGREVARSDGSGAPGTAAQAFAARRGTSQDLAHILVAAARHLEVPARCVTGYVRLPEGAAQPAGGHAWVEVKLPHLGWIGLDPSLGSAAGEGHVRVAVGFDCIGAAPFRGSGGTFETREVTLRVFEPGLSGTAAASQSQSQSQG